MGSGHQETDIRARLRAGERILNVFVVVRTASPRRRPRRPSPGSPVAAPPSSAALLAIRYVLYLRVTWRVGYHILRTFRDREDRTFRDFGRLLLLIEEEFGYREPFVLIRAGSRRLQRIRGVRPEDWSEGHIHFAVPRSATRDAADQVDDSERD